MATERVIFTYDPEQDQDIKRWLEAQSNRSGAIREAIRDKIRDRGIAETMRAVLRDELAGLTLAAGNGGDDNAHQADGPQVRDTDPDAGAALDAMF
jgi:Arc/MetJ-type ribon-helix-helix transcriptional regulator